MSEKKNEIHNAYEFILKIVLVIKLDIEHFLFIFRVYCKRLRFSVNESELYRQESSALVAPRSGKLLRNAGPCYT